MIQAKQAYEYNGVLYPTRMEASKREAEDSLRKVFNYLDKPNKDWQAYSNITFRELNIRDLVDKRFEVMVILSALCNEEEFGK